MTVALAAAVVDDGACGDDQRAVPGVRIFSGVGTASGPGDSIALRAVAASALGESGESPDASVATLTSAPGEARLGEDTLGEAALVEEPLPTARAKA
mmetsp:Transcript_8125/g.24706  ORF Transcript_8125/g.24706 Transcript_8125/m.24706 type:complete len:97 (+) Transcript_8125:873-1163(+)